jgi:hypothetical protein
MIDDFEKLSVTELRQRGLPSDQILAEQKRRGMTPQQIHDAWFPKPPSYNRIGSRRFRRGLVVATYGGWLLAAASFKLWMSPGVAFYFLPSFVGIVNSLLVLVWFGRKTYISRAVLERDSGLDERLVQNRNQAFRGAFQIFAPIAIIGWGLSLVTLRLQPGNEGWTYAFLIYSGAILLGVTLPTAIWAWREPDPTERERLPG